MDSREYGIDRPCIDESDLQIAAFNRYYLCIKIVTQSKRVFKEIKNSRLQKTSCDLEPRFSWDLQVQDILGRWKLVPMMKTSEEQGTLRFFWNDERSL